MFRFGDEYGLIVCLVGGELVEAIERGHPNHRGDPAKNRRMLRTGYFFFPPLPGLDVACDVEAEGRHVTCRPFDFHSKGVSVNTKLKVCERE